MRTTVLNTFAALFMVAAALSLEAYAQPSAIPNGFRALALPRSAIPIGARWRPGIGPDGAGANAGNLETVASVSSLSANHELSGTIRGALANYLNLGASARSSLRTQLSDLTLHRVASLEVLQISTGDTVLYEGLKANEISLSFQSSVAAEVHAAVRARGIPVIGDVSGGTGNTLRLDGRNLFVAYRVVEVRRIGNVQRTRRRLDSGGEGSVGPYELNLNFGDVANCICEAQRTGGALAGTNHCTERYPSSLLVTDPSRVTLSGESFQRTFSIRNRDQFPYRISLGAAPEGNQIVSSSLSVAAIYGPRYSQANGQGICFHFLDDDSYVELVRTRLRLIPVSDPQAPGW